MSIFGKNSTIRCLRITFTRIVNFLLMLTYFCPYGGSFAYSRINHGWQILLICVGSRRLWKPIYRYINRYHYLGDTLHQLIYSLNVTWEDSVYRSWTFISRLANWLPSCLSCRLITSLYFDVSWLDFVLSTLVPITRWHLSWYSTYTKMIGQLIHWWNGYLLSLSITWMQFKCARLCYTES